MRGPLPNVSPLTAPVLYTFQHVREDLARHIEPLTTEQLWARPAGLPSAGFHILHIAGSTDRLMTYLIGAQLTPAQLADLDAESDPPRIPLPDLLVRLEAVFARAEATVRDLDPATLPEPREIGRRRLPTTVAGLLTHIAEHTQRHLGQAITTAKFVAQTSRSAGLY
jgi:uncharacterized damage-inducible protein DinB